MKRGIPLFLTYALLAAVVCVTWALATLPEKVKGNRPDGTPDYKWSNLSRMVDGTAPAPFVGRRLLPDAARLLSRAVPAGAWAALADFLQGDSFPARHLRASLDYQGWTPANYPHLFTAYFLIWLSVLGFMYACRQLARWHYVLPEWVAGSVGAVLGVGLLGGLDNRWTSYSYDFPNAFLFALAMCAIVADRWWLLPVFAAACYSKETSVVLIFAYAAVRLESFRRPRYWLTLGLLGVLFVGIRFWIGQHYRNAPAADFWFPMRNLTFLAKQAVYNVWFLAVVGVVCVRIFLMRREVPRNLRRLLVMAPVLLAAGFFKGWIEERRQYLEVYPVVALIFLQWAALELGLTRLFRPRLSEEKGRADEAPPAGDSVAPPAPAARSEAATCSPAL